MTSTIADIKNPVLSIKDLSVAYDKNYAVKNVSVDVKKNAVTSHYGTIRMWKKYLIKGT